VGIVHFTISSLEYKTSITQIVGGIEPPFLGLDGTYPVDGTPNYSLGLRNRVTRLLILSLASHLGVL
jgi:hypothetical protein